MGMGDFVASTNKNREYPRDPFSHGFAMMDNTDDPIADDYHKVVGKHEVLGNVGDDVMLRLYQNDSRYLTWLFDMAQRDPELIPYYKSIAGIWRGEITLTRARDGLERKLQANVGQGFNVQEKLQAFGQQMGQLLQQREKDQTELIQRLMQKR